MDSNHTHWLFFKPQCFDMFMVYEMWNIRINVFSNHCMMQDTWVIMKMTILKKKSSDVMTRVPPDSFNLPPKPLDYEALLEMRNNVHPAQQAAPSVVSLYKLWAPPGVEQGEGIVFSDS